jgi:hypothetical protein
MPLTFDARGLLPPGIHDATLDEIDRVFGRFQKTDRRLTWSSKLKAYVREVKSTGWHCEIIVDGSFVMPMVDEPNDIDIILVLPADWDMNRDLKPFEYNVVSKGFTKKEYRVEVMPAAKGSDAERKYIELFGQVRIEWCQQFGWPSDSVKGIVRIVE